MYELEKPACGSKYEHAEIRGKSGDDSEYWEAVRLAPKLTWAHEFGFRETGSAASRGMRQMRQGKGRARTDRPGWGPDRERESPPRCSQRLLACVRLEMWHDASTVAVHARGTRRTASSLSLAACAGRKTGPETGVCGDR